MKMPFSTRNDRYSSANVIRLWCSFCCMIYPMIVPFSLALLLRPAYSRAQPTKSGKFGFAFSHLLLSVFTRCTKEATVSVGGNDTKIWTWSGIPPPYAIGLAVEISCYPIDVSIKFAIVFHGDCWFAAVSAEDDVVKRLCITHDLDILVCQVFVACFQHADYADVAATPHTALHFVSLMWGY